MQYLADGHPEPAEYDCYLNKILCSLSLEEVLDFGEPVTKAEAEECGLFLQAVIAQAPILKQLKSQMGNKVKIVKIDVDRNQPLANKLGIRSIPTLMIFQGGERKWQAMGVQNLAVLKQQLEKLVG